MSEPGFGVYIHWPFCAQKCPYCDFNSHVRFGGWDEGRYLAAYLRELSHTAERIAAVPVASGARRVASVFFGGGTPSLMKPETVGAILDHIAKLWPVAPGAEVTLEANPGSVEAQRFAGYKAAGVNRVSIGVQSLREADLKRLGRIHSVEEACAAIRIAEATFERFSFDLIYARPHQTVAEWRVELAEALAMSGRHLSLYQLTIEPETPFAELYARGKLVIPPAEAAHDLYEATQEMCEAAGLPAYEISNHAEPGQESQHNLLYWRYGAYAGVGPGAHGRLPWALPSGEGRVATSTEKSPEAWLQRVETTGASFVEEDVLGREALADEMLLMGLRLSEGLDLNRLAALGGVVIAPQRLDELVREGLIERLDAVSAARHVAAIDHGVDEIRACLGPGLSPQKHALGRIRATGRARFILNELVLQCSSGFEPASGGNGSIALQSDTRQIIS